MSTTPLTDLLRFYRQLSEPGYRGLVARLCVARQFSKDPAKLVALFEQSLQQFARYSNPTQFFHEGEISGGRIAVADSPVVGACAPIKGSPPETIKRTIDFARWVNNLGICEVAGKPELAFAYVDRELDCLRTSPGQPLEDGSPSKRALVLDLLLKNSTDGIPILAELKIQDDEDALYGLIQCLCAAVHLLTEPQRTRLRSVYGLTSVVRDSGPYLDLYVIFFRPKNEGQWPNVLSETLKVRNGLLQQPEVATRIRRIEFLKAELIDNTLEFACVDPSKLSAEDCTERIGGKPSYRETERARLMALGGPSLYVPFRNPILSYYREYGISWWGGGDGPTDNPISSQVACINHLEPARLSGELALNVAQKHVPDAIAVLPLDNGYLAYEWIGKRSYLNEHGWSSSSRGRNVTSLDAIMAVKRENGTICLLVIEWKYTECYEYGLSLAISKHGTRRIDIYRAFLEHADSPIRLGTHERLFFDPFYQLMRQTLLAWQMVEHREFGATEWLHLHVVPAANEELLGMVTSPELVGFGDMACAWRSVLKRPECYSLVTPKTLVPDVPTDGEFGAWREWLRKRYLI